MALSLIHVATGLGIQRSTGTYYRWHNHSFNPTSNISDGYQTWDFWGDPSDVYPGPVVYSAQSSFDLTGYQYGIELVMFVLKFQSDTADSGTFSHIWKDPDGNTLNTFSGSWNCPGAGYWWYSWSGDGIKANGSEIHKNGTYTIQYSVTGNYGSLSGSVTFTVSNFPAATSSSNLGRIWVEGNHLCYICYQGYKIQLPTDGTGTYVDGTKAGSVWMETNGKIAYIDATGNKRSTKKGDRYGFDGWTTEIPGSPGTAHAGKIWVSNSSEADTYLVIISPDGNKYRIGAGAITGDHQ
jgi:hypothetical protein